MLKPEREPYDDRQTDAPEHAAAAPPGSDTAGPWLREKQRHCLPREVIYHESDAVERVFLIRNGLVKLLSYLPNGRARIVRLYTAGQWLGLEGLLAQPYAHTAIAVGDVELLCCPVGSLQRLRQENAGALGELLSQWHGDLVTADQWIVDFSTGGIRSRVARLLIYLARLEFGPSGDRVALLTVQEMADILGVTQESVSRILAEFKRSELLSQQPDPAREVFRLDSLRLERVAVA